MTKQTANDTRRLAAAFAKVIREWLTAEELQEVAARNALPRYQGCCATHDFCDANEAMAEAWSEVFGECFDLQSDADMVIVDRAWDLARASNFAE